MLSEKELYKKTTVMHMFLILTQMSNSPYLRKRDRIPFPSFSPQDLALVLKENGSIFSSVSGETEPYSLLLLVSSTRTGTGKDILRRYSI